MREAFGELFTMDGDLLCITTNGTVNTRGHAIMGAGCALEARRRFIGIERSLGERITAEGNHVHDLGEWRDFVTGHYMRVASFPTKQHWADASTLALIEQSARELNALLAWNPWTVLLPRPGCNNGRLEWSVVRPRLEAILDDRVIAVGYAAEAR